MRVYMCIIDAMRAWYVCLQWLCMSGGYVCPMVIMSMVIVSYSIVINLASVRTANYSESVR